MQDHTSPENKPLDAGEATARRLYADWICSMNQELRTAWQDTRGDVNLKEKRAAAYKAAAASAGRRETIAYVNHLLETSMKKYRTHHLSPEARIETMSAINQGVAITLAEADPDKGSILGYLHAVVRSERGNSLRMQSLPLSKSGLETWARIRQIEKTASAAITDDEIVAQLKNIKGKNGIRVHTDKSIEEAQRYRKLGVRARASLDIPAGDGHEDTAQAMRVQATEYEIATTQQNTSTPSLESPFMRQFRHVVDAKLNAKEKEVILRRFVNDESIQGRKEKGICSRAIQKLRRNKSLAALSKNIL